MASWCFPVPRNEKSLKIVYQLHIACCINNNEDTFYALQEVIFVLFHFVEQERESDVQREVVVFQEHKHIELFM